METNKKKIITAQNTFTPWVSLNGTFNVLISGLVGSTVTFQGSIDGGITPYDIQSWSGVASNTKIRGSIGNSTDVYRIGVKTGNYASDTITVKLEA
jgi:hypothetical protein